MADLDIPAPSIGPAYRVSRPRQTLDVGTKRLLIAAGGVMGALLLLAGGWTAARRHNAPIPVIEADGRPVRVKPEHPGGMQVAGADEQVMGDGPGQAEAMAPPAEAPAPQALRAQAAPVAAPVQATQPVPQTPNPAAPATAPIQTAAPVPIPTPATPPAATTQAAAPAQPRATAAAVPARPASAGAMQVQLAALESEQAAAAEWQRLSKRMPELLGSRHHAVQRAEVDGKTVWRLRIAGFADMADATSFCGKVRAKGGGCSLASF